MITSFSSECIIMGNLNVVQDESERLGSQFNLATAVMFNQFNEQADLLDVPLGGPMYTWSDT